MSPSVARARLTRREASVFAGGGVIAIVALGVIALVIFQLLPDLFAPGQHTRFGPKDAEEAREAVRTSGLQFVGGVVLVIGAVLTALNLRQTRLRDEEQRRANDERARIDQERQITERFTRAIDRLDGGALDVRLGGIYALERIARESSDDHGPIMEVLTAFVREHVRGRHASPRRSCSARRPMYLGRRTRPPASSRWPPARPTGSPTARARSTTSPRAACRPGAPATPKDRGCAG
jgi:hypothetical protein